MSQQKTNDRYIDTTTYDEIQMEINKIDYVAHSLQCLQEHLPQNMVVGVISIVHEISANIQKAIDDADADKNKEIIYQDT